MSSFWDVLAETERLLSVIWTLCTLWRTEELEIVCVVKDHDPLPVARLLQPLFHQQQYVRPGSVMTRDFALGRDDLERLSKALFVASVDPVHGYIRVLNSHAVGEL